MKAIKTIVIMVLSTAFTVYSQVWFAKNISNLTPDEARRFYNFGDNCGVFVGKPPMSGNETKLDSWNEKYNYYILYPLFKAAGDSARKKEAVDTLAASPGKKDSSKKCSGAKPERASTGADTANQGTAADTLPVCKDEKAIREYYGKVLFTYKGKIVLKTWKELQPEEFAQCYDISRLANMP
ncbi:MAG: hypothetical protein JW768_12365 [Chitinispirillaceae bacterium]|nr:hypothetical protein [Chitinispirillaceae bacterium]